MHRILDISEAPARLRIEHGCLCVEASDAPGIRIPACEVAVVVLAHPQITCTQAVLSELAAAGGVLVICDGKRLPVGLQLPLQSHYVQGERFLAQARAKLPLRKRLWQEIVQAKIRLQGSVLMQLRGTDAGLTALARTVQSGDPSNVEAQAARRYWQHLFPGVDFHRDRDAPNQNQLLNYGYAVLRAIAARAACAAGLHPSLGVHHRNRYNPFCLADDIMEPFRPAIDTIVAQMVEERGTDAPLAYDSRRRLLDAVCGHWRVNEESRSLFEANEMLASSLVENFLGPRRRLRLPALLEPSRDASPA
ncbi:MAG TPA: type II CRISPR-associated endonuclease Cas1 [Pirellulales bacterium]|jgi:CRISPR-associated protein Cas1|nr:type II CRISPR-associated endonuclease Cas1 [Pirellulales bacterium]